MNSKIASKALVLCALSSLLSAGGMGCSKGGDKSCLSLKAPPKQGTPVATFQGGSITVEEINKRLGEMPPPLRTRFQAPEQKKQFVDRLAQMELLAQEGLNKGLQNDPEVLDAAKRVLAQKVMQKDLEAMDTPATDAELATYYEQHKSDYVKPETVRLFDIFLAAPKGDAAKVAAQRKKATELAKKLKAAQPQDFVGFQTLATQNSDDARTKSAGGNMNFLSEADLTAQYGPEVAAAARGLKNPGDLAGPIQTDRGFYLLKLSSRTQPLNLTLQTVQAQVKNRIQYERHAQNVEKYLADLKKRLGYKLDEGALSQVAVSSAAPPPAQAAPRPVPVKP